MKRFRLVERIGEASAEVVFAYPNFETIAEGLEYIRTILDPYFTGHYGIVDETLDKPHETSIISS